jgi:hypothetical protein
LFHTASAAALLNVFALIGLGLGIGSLRELVDRTEKVSDTQTRKKDY